MRPRKYPIWDFIASGFWRSEKIKAGRFEMQTARLRRLIGGRISKLFNRLLCDAAIVRVQNPIVLNNYREPQPDIAMLKPRPDFYATGHPMSNDILLIVEVADSSEEYDRETKLPRYAESGIVEVLLVLLTDDIIEGYAQPVNGAYQIKHCWQRGEAVKLVGFPKLTLQVEDLLG